MCSIFKINLYTLSSKVQKSFSVDFVGCFTNMCQILNDLKFSPAFSALTLKVLKFHRREHAVTPLCVVARCYYWCWLHFHPVIQAQRDIIFELRRIAFDGETDPTGTEKRKAMYTKDYKMLGFTVSLHYRGWNQLWKQIWIERPLAQVLSVLNAEPCEPGHGFHPDSSGDAGFRQHAVSCQVSPGHLHQGKVLPRASLSDTWRWKSQSHLTQLVTPGRLSWRTAAARISTNVRLAAAPSSSLECCVRFSRLENYVSRAVSVKAQ